MKLRVTEWSQVEKLLERTEQAGIRHNETALVVLRSVEVLSEGEVRFCNLGYIYVQKVLKPGDSAPLPLTAVIKGKVPAPGFYHLTAVVTPNSRFQIKVREAVRLSRAV